MGQDPRTASTIIYLALLGGQLAFAAVAVMIERSVAPPADIPADTMLTVSCSVAFLAIPGSRIVSRMLLRKAKSRTSLKDRMSAALGAFVVRLAVLEGAGLISLLAYLFAGELIFLGIFGIVLVAFVFGRPSETEWEEIEAGRLPVPDTTNLPPSIS